MCANGHQLCGNATFSPLDRAKADGAIRALLVGNRPIIGKVSNSAQFGGFSI